MLTTKLASFVLAVLLTTSAAANELPPLEAYGELPMFDLFELSPNGKLAAARVVDAGRDVIVIIDVDEMQPLFAAGAVKVNPRWLNFVDDNYVVLVAGQTVRNARVRGRSFYYGHAYSFDLTSKEIRPLMTRARNLYEFQGGLGRIVGRDPESQTLYMPAFVDSVAPAYGIYAVSLDQTRERLAVRGNRHTIDWFLGADGKPVVREDFDDTYNVHRIWRVDAKGKNEKLLYEEETELRQYGTVGITADRGSLVLQSSSSYSGASSYYLLNLEHAAISGPVLSGGGLDVEKVITDVNRVVYGVEYAGFRPTYAFLDEELGKRVDEVQQRLAGVTSRLVSWSEDFERLLFEIDGGWSAGAYLVFDKSTVQPIVLGKSRPTITRDFVAPVQIIDYEAGDGRIIPALVTARQDVREAGHAPLIVMPHGGPMAHDKAGFDWMAQYFASRGYMVLQPQYRGSDGFGHDHRVAGHGEYGRGMLSDIDDGVRHLIVTGAADASRVCSVGISYGGYAALAAGAFSADMYRCIVSIAGVSDLPRKMARLKTRSGRDDSSIDYWERLYGVEVSDRDALRAMSPAYHAAAFVAPVLLIHGEQDTLVHIDQSTRMNRALRKADKDVSYIKLKGEDHWLSKAESRVETLRAVAEFIEQHL